MRYTAAILTFYNVNLFLKNLKIIMCSQSNYANPNVIHTSYFVLFAKQFYGCLSTVLIHNLFRLVHITPAPKTHAVFQLSTYNCSSITVIIAELLLECYSEKVYGFEVRHLQTISYLFHFFLRQHIYCFTIYLSVSTNYIFYVEYRILKSCQQLYLLCVQMNN